MQLFSQYIEESILLQTTFRNILDMICCFLLQGESVDDCGGGYSESIAEMCEELQNGLTPLLIVTPNGRDESGANRDCFLLNPAAKSVLHMNMFRFLGKFPSGIPITQTLIV